MGKEGIRDEAFTELIIHLKLLCVLGSENFMNRVSENRAHQNPWECASGNCPPVALGNDLVQYGGGLGAVSGIYRFWLGKDKIPLPPLPALPY